MLLPLLVFIILLVMGVSMEEWTWLHVGLYLFIAVAIAAAFTVFQWPVVLYFVGLALVDIVMLLVIFQGDVRIR
jgi:hypothetical protein